MGGSISAEIFWGLQLLSVKSTDTDTMADKRCQSSVMKWLDEAILDRSGAYAEIGV